MNKLTEIQQALDAKQQAWDALAAAPPYPRGRDARKLDDYELAAHKYSELLDDDVIRWLLDVAYKAIAITELIGGLCDDAATVDVCMDRDHNCSRGQRELCIRSIGLIAALSPLVKEADE